MKNAAFSSMRIRMFERSLLTSQQLERMITAEDLAQAVRVLQETRYGERVSALDRAEDFEQALSAELSHQADKIVDVTKDDVLTRLLFLRYDYHNLKILIKSSSDPERFERLLFSFGTLFVPKIKQLIEKPKNGAGATRLEKAVAEGVKVWQSTNDAQALDFVLDRAYFEELHALADETKSDFFREYAREMTDFTNLLSFFRAKRQQQSRHFISEIFMPGGSIRLEELLAPKIMTQVALPDGQSSGENVVDVSEMRMLLNRKPVSSLLLEAVEHYAETGDITMLEKARDEYSYRKAMEGGRTPMGPEVIFAYLTRVETEVQNIHIILSGKRVGLSPEQIRSRVRYPEERAEQKRGTHA